MLLVAAAGWWALPDLIRLQVNARLNAIPGYSGRVGWVSVDLRHHSYTLHDFLVVKRNGRVHWPYFYSPAIEIAVGWRPEGRGGLCGRVRAQSASITFVQGADADRSQMDVDARWTRAAHAIFPLPITRLEIAGGSMLYLDTCRRPNLALSLTDLHVLAQDRAPTATSPWSASIALEACCLGGGRLAALVLSDPATAQPHFAFSARVDAVSLPALNELFVAYADVGLKGGTLGMRLQIDGRDGHFAGFIKPSFEHLEFAPVGGKGRGLGQEIIGSLAAVAANVMKRQVEARLEDQIPIAGDFGDSRNDFLAAVKAVLRAGGRISLAQPVTVTSQ